MRIMKVSFLVVVFCVIGYGLFLLSTLGTHENTAQIGNSHSLPQDIELKDAAAAEGRAFELTGIIRSEHTPLHTRQLVLDEDKTPFLSHRLVGKLVWRVEFRNVTLRLKSVPARYQDRYRRTFTILLDPATGQPLRIASEFDGDTSDMRPEPPAAEAERQLRSSKEVYHGFPDEPPSTTFMEALDAIVRGGYGNPLVAKEIDAVYVMHSNLGSIPRPVWAITLRGMPPSLPSGPGAASANIPVWILNRMRNVIDARTGKVLFATNIPNPVSNE